MANSLEDTVSVLPGNGNGTFGSAVKYDVGDIPYWVAIGDLNGDSFPDLVVTNNNDHDLSLLLGNGDGTFQTALDFETGHGPYSVAIGDLDGAWKPDLAVANFSYASVLINTVETIDGILTCLPASGTVPFSTNVSVSLENLYTGQTRRIAGRINLFVASGHRYNNWKSGWTNVGVGSSNITSWNQSIPELGSVIGDNVFILEATDVTPSPYNQSPHPPSGYTDTDICTVVGIAP